MPKLTQIAIPPGRLPPHRSEDGGELPHVPPHALLQHRPQGDPHCLHHRCHAVMLSIIIIIATIAIDIMVP